MGSYEDAMAQLNEAQRVAVTTIDGPLLVVAGPGTGKTQLLSTRVAHILANTDAPASSILCVTFTNKAALNMRERVLQVTDGRARDVHVKTFHSFAAELMNIYPDYFWNGARLTSVPDAIQQEIIQNVLASLPLTSPLALKFFGKFTAVKDVLGGLKLAKEAGLTPDKLRSIIGANVAYIELIEKSLANILNSRLTLKKLQQLQQAVTALPSQHIDELVSPLVSLSTILTESLEQAIQLDTVTGKTTHTSKWKSRWTQTIDGSRAMFKERERNQWWLELADVYEQYRNELHSRGYYDYSDMLVEVISQIEQNSQLRADIQERYLYVMIDEFQDTNAAQLRLAQLVSDHHADEGKPNIMAVGDDDQSIFKFNGAELGNMLHFRRHYPTAKTVILTENYRSNQAILDLSEAIAQQASDRLVLRDPSLKKRLQAKSNTPNGVIRHIIYKTQDEQLSDIAQLLAKNFSHTRQQAVIARSHASLQQIASLLIKLNVPLHYEQQRNILDHPLVEQVCLLAEALCAINDGDIEGLNGALSHTLRHPMWLITAEDLWKIAIDNYRSADWLQSLAEHKNPTMQQHANFLLELAAHTQNENIHVALEYILGLREVGGVKSPLYDYFTSRQNTDASEYLQGLSAVQALRNLVNEYSLSGVASLTEFVSFVRLERQSGEIITDESPFVTGEHAVSLLTVHKAKGLEFDDVYVIDVVENIWQPKAGGRKAPANLPLQPVGDDMDDYVRMLFVAVTRAKQNLTISSFEVQANGRECLPSPLISSVVEPTHPKYVIEPIAVLTTALSWPRLNSNDEKTLLKARLDSYSLSVTHLMNFLDVSAGGPSKFLERNLLRLPEAKTASLAYGSAMHAALEQAQILANSSSFDMEKVLKTYKQALQREHMPFAEQERYTNHGTKVLQHVFNQKLLQLEKGSLPEQNINDVRIGVARLSGKIDRIDQQNDKIFISDYKTGKPLTNFSSKAENQAIKAWKQRTQLIFYALLLQNSSRIVTKHKTLIGQMIYLESKSQKEFVNQYSPTENEILRLASLVQVVWQCISSLELPDTTIYSSDIAGIQAFEDDLLQNKVPASS